MRKEFVKNKKMVLCVAAYFLISVFIRGYFSDFPKRICVYTDELRYFELARSIFHGKGLMIHNAPVDYQKILYSIVIMPALLFKSPDIQVRTIGWINSIVMSSAVFPAFVLAKRILKKETLVHIVLILLVTMPIFVTTVYFMSEVLFLPLSLWINYVVFVIIREDSYKARVRLNVCLGILLYAAYLNKEIALYYLLAYLATRLGYMALHWDKRKEESICLGSMLITFLLCFIMMKLTFFYGMGNSYDQMDLAAILSVHKIIYLMYGFIYDFLFAIFALGVFTVLIPIASIGKKQDDRQRQYICFILCSLLIGCGTVAYTITVRDDFPVRSPRQYLRYIEPLFLPFFISMLSVLDHEKDEMKENTLKKTGALLFFYSILFVGIIYGTGDGPCVDDSTLKFFGYLMSLLKPHAFMGLNVEWQMLLLRELFVVVWFLYFWLFCRYRKYFFKVIILSLLGLNLVNYKLAYSIARQAYEISSDSRKEMVETAGKLDGLQGNILLITEYENDYKTKWFDTYVDHASLYRTNLKSLYEKGFLENEVVDLSYEHTEDIMVENSNLDQVHWIIAPKSISFQKDSVQEMQDFPLTDYRLYRNKEIGKIYMEPLFPSQRRSSSTLAEDDVFYSDADNKQYISEMQNQKFVCNPNTFITKGSYRLVINYQYLKENDENQGQAVGVFELGNNEAGNLAVEVLTSGKDQIIIDQFDIQENLWIGEFRMFAFTEGVKFEKCVIERMN